VPIWNTSELKGLKVLSRVVTVKRYSVVPAEFAPCKTESTEPTLVNVVGNVTELLLGVAVGKLLEAVVVTVADGLESRVPA